MSEQPYQPRLSHAGLAPTHAVTALDEYGQTRDVHVAGESPLTLYVDGREIVTLMTLGTHPEALALGYLRTQRFIEDIHQIVAVTVNWDTESVHVETREGVSGWDEKLRKRTITTGCGQGTVFSCTLDKLYDIRLPAVRLRQSGIYRQAGAVHGCGLWLEHQGGGDKIFYTTGRLTSEIVMKVTQMGIPLLLSRSGVTHMGLELARKLGVTMIARAKGRCFLVYSGAENIDLDAIPAGQAGDGIDGKPKSGAA